MTPEQKAKAAERLKAARAKKKPAENKSIAKSVVELDEEDFLHHENVKRWIKTQTDLQTYLKKQVRNNVRHANSKLNTSKNYVQQMRQYLREGIWLSLFAGEYMDILLKEPAEWQMEDYEDVRFIIGGRWGTGYRLIEEPNSICFEGRGDFYDE